MNLIWSETKKETSSLDIAEATINIYSPGWSGKVIKTDASDIEDRKFMLTAVASQRSTLLDSTDRAEGRASGGYVDYNANGNIVCISLEHFGIYDPGVTSGGVQVRGRNGQGGDAAAWGAAADASGMVINSGNIYFEENHAKYGVDLEIDIDQTDVSLTWANIRPNFEYSDLPARIYGNWQAISTSSITTDLPIFATDADALAWVASNFEDVSKMLNYTTPEEEYIDNNNCWYVHNVFGHNTKDRQSYTGYRNYRFFPKTGRICFYRQTPSASDPYALKLLSYTGYDTFKAGAWDSAFEEYSGNIESSYMTKSAQYASNDYYTVFVNAEGATNIPIFDTLSQATDYINRLIDITEASNYADIARDESTVIPNDWGEDVTATDLGTNGQNYNLPGARLYGLGLSELTQFFLDVYDTANVQDIIDGNKLLSGQEINNICGCMFLPISDLSKICELGSTQHIHIGSWSAPNGEGTLIGKNNKLMNMGSVVVTPTYYDQRDYPPYTRLYVMLPYAGTYELSVDKYMNKTLTVKAGVDITSGAVVFYLFANDVLLDHFTGNLGAQRPITCIDNAQYVSNVVNGVMGSGSAMTSGASSLANSLGSMGGGMSSLAGGAGAVAGAAAISATGVYKGFELLQTVDTPPMTTQGALTGNLGYSGIQSVYFVCAQKKSVRPSNERQVVGYPSGQGGTINTFSGFLSCRSVKLADGFTGSEIEREELITILNQGIYL